MANSCPNNGSKALAASPETRKAGVSRDLTKSLGSEAILKSGRAGAAIALDRVERSAKISIKKLGASLARTAGKSARSVEKKKD